MQFPQNLEAHIAPQDNKPLLIPRMEDSNLCQLWRLTHILVKVRKGELDLKDRDRKKYLPMSQ